MAGLRATAGMLLCAAAAARGAAAPAVACDEPDEAGLLQAKTASRVGGAKGSKDTEFTFLNPDPEVMVWDKEYPINDNLTVKAGWLNVPLFYDEVLSKFAKPPVMCLRVWGIQANQQPAAQGPLLSHNGGPVSTMESVFAGMDWGPPIGNVRQSFDLLGISQRGMNRREPRAEAPINESAEGLPPCPFKQEDGEPAGEYPVAACNEVIPKMEELCGGPLLNCTESDADEWLADVLPDNVGPESLQEMVDSFSDPLWWRSETKVRWRYRLSQLNHNLCFAADRYNLTAPDGHSYNVLNYMGTVHLAHDLDRLRQALGSDKLSIRGASYGTTVGAVYGTLYPDSVHRMILDGVRTPEPDVLTVADASCKGDFSVWNSLAQACDNSVQQGLPAQDLCPLAPASTTKLFKLIKSGGAIGEEAHALAHAAIYDDIIPAVAMKNLSDMFKEYESGALVQTARAERPMVSDWLGDTYGAAVLGLDTAGRLSEEDLVSWWQRSSEIYPVGVGRGLGYAIKIGTWPAIPRPTPPNQDSTIEPLIVGNLWDPNTAYANAQKMAEGFPRGALVTWQGRGHCMQAPANATRVAEIVNEMVHSGEKVEFTEDESKYLCMATAWKYLETGRLPQKGYVCPAPGPARLGPGAAAEAA